MTWKIEYITSFKKEVRKLGPQMQKRIREFLEIRLVSVGSPSAIGEALKGAKFVEYWKYRVGDCHIICDIQDKNLIILALREIEEKFIAKVCEFLPKNSLNSLLVA